LKLPDDDPQINAIQGYIAENLRYEFDKLYHVVRLQGFGKHRLHRIYKARLPNLSQLPKVD
jgi:hypothetical protein